ncbi:cilia- and flagella-associated protein 77 isoform 2-T2 [Discoglossus pictus]
MAELGKIKTRCYTVPGPNFTYGMNSNMKEGGVAEATGHWDTVASIPRVIILEPHYVSLNREAVKSGMVTAGENYIYRKSHHIWRKPREGVLKDVRVRLPPNMTFGIPSRPSTPIYDLLENKFQHLWVEQQRQITQNIRKKQLEKYKSGKIQDTRTTLLRRYQPPEEPTPLWQLPRFQKIGPHLDTFPTQEERQKAFRAQSAEGVARKGLQGRGIYNFT